MLILLILFAFYTTLSESVKVEVDTQRECKNVFIFNTTNCTSWREAKLTGDVNDYKVTVCRTEKTKALVQPINYVWLDDAEVKYNLLTNKFYIKFKVQLTSSRILDEISKRPEFNNTQVSFMDVTQVRFVAASPDFYELRKEIKLYGDWMKIDKIQSDVKYAELKFRADTKEAAANIISPSEYSEAKLGNALKETVRVEMKISQDDRIIRTSLKTKYPLLNTTDLECSAFAKKAKQKDTKPRFPESNQDFRLILIQRRETPGLDFNRNWTDYKNGFGYGKNDFWLGLEKIYQITKDGGYGLRMEFESHKGLQRSAQWENFRVGSEAEKYKLIISGFDTKSSAGYDSMARSNGHGFATVDKDNSQSCASLYGGGWWYEYRCTKCHFNNLLRSSIAYAVTCVHYHDFTGNTYIDECLKRVKMFIIKH